MRLPRMTALLLLFCAISLSACGPESLVVQKLPDLPPLLIQPQRLECPESRPRVPDPATATQRDVSKFLERYEAWGDGCDVRWAELREILRPSLQ